MLYYGVMCIDDSHPLNQSDAKYPATKVKRLALGLMSDVPHTLTPNAEIYCPYCKKTKTYKQHNLIAFDGYEAQARPFDDPRLTI